VGTVFNVTGGYILGMAPHNQPPGSLLQEEREFLRELAFRVREIAALPIQEKRRNLWIAHNDLRGTRPMVALYPEDCWAEVLPESACTLTDPFWKQWEWYLRHLLYRHEYYVDDFVVEPDVWVPAVVEATDYGLNPVIHHGGQKGSYVWEAPIQNEKDVEKLRVPEYRVNHELSNLRLAAVQDALGDILPVHMRYVENIVVNLVGEYTYLRGITQFYCDMLDNPGLVHRLMGFFADCITKKYKTFEEAGLLQTNNRNHYVDSGGNGYTQTLPGVGSGQGGKALLCDLWCHGVAQEMSEVSPDMHRTFLLAYQKRIMDLCGLVGYGCCEPYTHKFDMLREDIPNLRRVSVSPWCDVEKAALKLKRDYIYSFKPNPSVVINTYSEKNIREYIRPVLEKTQGCEVELIHKDLFSIMGEPQRLARWTNIVRDEVARIYGE